MCDSTLVRLKHPRGALDYSELPPSRVMGGRTSQARVGLSPEAEAGGPVGRGALIFLHLSTFNSANSYLPPGLKRDLGSTSLEYCAKRCFWIKVSYWIVSADLTNHRTLSSTHSRSFGL